MNWNWGDDCDEEDCEQTGLVGLNGSLLCMEHYQARLEVIRENMRVLQQEG